jgi:tRNA modification GTPase
MGRFHPQLTDTIVAVSTPRGYSGVGVIRMSGPDAISIARQMFHPAKGRPELPDRRAIYGRVIDPECGSILDDGIALVMRGPASYTGEDVVEISIHGSPVVLDMVTHLIVKMGARHADRGEFTRRAFLCGHIDLVQAEAIIDLIEATSPLAAHEARGRLDRDLSNEIAMISSDLKDLVAQLDALIDFDEDDEEAMPSPEPLLRGALSRMERLIREAAAGRIRREGIKTVVVGKPNVGKSTLFNALLRSDRMIVTPYPGTTRDPVEERLILGEVSFAIWDTAGLRDRPDAIEAEGIRRTRKQMLSADLALAVFDGSMDLNDEDRGVVCACHDKETVIILNKVDLGSVLDPRSADLGPDHWPRLQLSAATGTGLDSLLGLLQSRGAELARGLENRSHAALTHRCLQLMETAATPMRSLILQIETGCLPGPEIVSLELRRALAAIQEITGERMDDEILDRIFGRFCIGK